jgi:prephenate dehydratase
MLKIGYLGPRGTFSHEAMEKYTSLGNYTSYEYNAIHEMFNAIQKRNIDEAIVPIENSLEGAVNETMDMLATEEGLKIKAELVVPVRQNLLVKKGTGFNDIRRILSHPQPIGQCRNYINTYFAGVNIKYVYSTAGAAEEVSKGGDGLAAIASMKAAEVYGLEVLAQSIQDADDNFTRFTVIAKNDSERTGNDKTSVVFSTENRPGSLYRVLDIFNLWDINLTRIESRPAKNQLGKYIFFVDLVGHRDDDDIKDALTMVRRKTSLFKFLGSYPVFMREIEQQCRQ